MNTLLLFGVVIFVVIGGFAFVIYVMNQKLGELKNDSALGLIKQDLQGITQSLERSQTHMQDSLTKQFSQSGQIIRDVTERLTKLDETNKQVLGITDELKMLQNILRNPKQRGGIGEFYLDSVIGNVLPTGHYKLQYEFKDGEKVDAVIILDKGKLLPVDSKFSLENYNRLIEEKDSTIRESLVRTFKQDLKTRIDETAKYIRPSEGTMDFAFMFIPSEAIYYDLLINKIGTVQTSSKDLIEYAFRDKRVIIVSPTSFLAYLQTVMQGLRSLQIESQAKEIQERVGRLGQHIAAYESYYQKLGNSLSTTVGHYNTGYKELGKIDKDVIKITGSEAVIEPLALDKPQQGDFE